MDRKSACQQLAEQIGHGNSKVVPRILETLVDEDEARLLLAASPPATVDALAQRSGMDTGTIETLIDPLLRKGLLFKSKEPDATYYYRVGQVLQLLDVTAMMNNPPTRLMALWREYMATEWEARHARTVRGGRSPS